MNKELILEIIRSDLHYLKREFGLQSIGLFGSYSTGAQKEESDIDFLVKVNTPYAKNFFGLWDYLEKKFNRKIDLTRDGKHLRENFVNTINKEIVYA